MKAIAVAFTILAVASTFGKSGGISVLDGIQNADVIARVRIDDDFEVLPRYASGQNLREYRNLATASLIETFRAPPGVDKIKIQHMNSLACPNVIYTKGREYVVFLQKAVDSEGYVTMGTNSGQFRIEDDQVARFVFSAVP